LVKLLNLPSPIPPGRGPQSGIDRCRTGPWAGPFGRTRSSRMTGCGLQTGPTRVVTLCPRRGQKDDPQIELIFYAEYSRFRGAPSDLIGIGTYLDENRGFSKYAGSTTLPGYYKSRWSSSIEGIPRKIRNSLGGNLDRELPPYLTHDLLWLCACIYRHIATCNHHKEVARQLGNFQNRLCELHQGVHPSASDPQCAEPVSEGWPIHDVSDRRCPLRMSPSISNPAAAAAVAE